MRRALRKAGEVQPGPTEALLEVVVGIAQREIGNGELGRNNAGPHVARYRGDNEEAAWCAAFVGYCFEQAAHYAGVDMPFKRSNGAKRIWKNIIKMYRKTDTPRPGDVVCWDRGKLGSWQGHVGIVSRVDYPAFWTIEGNKGLFPSKVAEYRHEIGEGRLMGFATLRPDD